MQTQSLGSPGSNHHHHIHGGVTAVNSPLTSATEPPQDSKKLSLSGEEDEEKTKVMKPSHRSSSLSSPIASKQKKNPEKLIHGIPILTFVCFLVLYLSSHDPSQFEMDAFGGFKKRPETTHIDGMSVSVSVSGVTEKTVANRRRRDLREAEAGMKIRVHRKLGDF